jgi:hypothetical protein
MRQEPYRSRNVRSTPPWPFCVPRLGLASPGGYHAQIQSSVMSARAPKQAASFSPRRRTGSAGGGRCCCGRVDAPAAESSRPPTWQSSSSENVAVPDPPLELAMPEEPRRSMQRPQKPRCPLVVTRAASVGSLQQRTLFLGHRHQLQRLLLLVALPPGIRARPPTTSSESARTVAADQSSRASMVSSVMGAKVICSRGMTSELLAVSLAGRKRPTSCQPAAYLFTETARSSACVCSDLRNNHGGICIRH